MTYLNDKTLWGDISPCNNITDVNIYRYQKKTDFLKYTANYWNKAVNMIANGMIDPSDEISPHYEVFKEFGLENKLFAGIADMSDRWIDLIKYLQAKSNYQNLNAEMISKIVHYCIIKLFIETIEMVDDVKKKTGIVAVEKISLPGELEGNTIKKDKFMIDADGSLIVAKPSLKEKFAAEDKLKTQIANLLATEEGVIIDAKDAESLDISGTPVTTEEDDDSSIDLVKNIMKKNSTVLEILINFVKKIINKVINEQNTHDIITLEYIEKKGAEFLQKTQQLNLKVFAKIIGNQDERDIIMLKMRMGDVQYAELYSEYLKRHDNFDETVFNNEEEIDDIYGRAEEDMAPDFENEEEQREYNFMGLSNDEMNEAQMGNYIGDDNNLDDYMDSYDG